VILALRQNREPGQDCRDHVIEFIAFPGWAPALSVVPPVGVPPTAALGHDHNGAEGVERRDQARLDVPGVVVIQAIQQDEQRIVLTRAVVLRKQHFGPGGPGSPARWWGARPHDPGS
jgi:hypothetical protein